VDEAERLLDEALQKLPRHAAPWALKRGLAQRYAVPARPRRTHVFIAAGALAAAALLAVIPLRLDRTRGALAEGAVDEHVLVLRGETPTQIVSSGIHEVKPWFQGKLDFAPAVSFGGDAEFPLLGGAVASFLGRPAACLEYGRRAHRISLFILRADGLGFPGRPDLRTVRGFNVALWRRGDLAYALVSDLDRAELASLAERL
jgi:anti-sigma factor RsiW